MAEGLLSAARENINQAQLKETVERGNGFGIDLSWQAKIFQGGRLSRPCMQSVSTFFLPKRCTGFPQLPVERNRSIPIWYYHIL